MRTEFSSVRLRTSLSPFFRQDRRNCYNITFILEKRVTRTNLITGFLGSGKTTSILHLLAQKPADEKMGRTG
ncbi:metal chaperone [Klebsiella pneumoniae subsp. ozaenae]|uniref:Metal chaperone n=1 Tax=Klebsiella pneumoniae subsp. ozaenae TaxID=574 RepID=A0A377ZA86_KLEPO|nr:metal chaperone [Klebsiella pneumoniae subsp. ozaenae]